MTPDPAPAPRRRFGTAALVGAMALSAAGAGGAVWLLSRPDAPATPAAGAPAGASAGDHAGHAAETWICPMHPSVVRDGPGTCPICGMALVKQEASAQGGASDVKGMSTVTIDAARQQLIGLRTAPVAKGRVGGAWKTVGRVAVDETRVRHINLKVPGYVERIYVDFIGKPVRAGDPLFSIYSPELLVAQEEYLLALRTRGALGGKGGLGEDGDALVASARRKLELWDVPRSALDRIARTGRAEKTLTLTSPISGVVVKKDVVQGMKLDAGAMPYEIVDLSSVWVLADVYESELRHVRPGMPATLSLKAFPNRVFAGKVAFVDPLLDPATRTVKVRLQFPNDTGDLRPEMFGDVTLRGQAREALRIPADAVIPSGNTQVVFVALGEGRFQPRTVRTGEGDGERVEVVSGLTEGEQVVLGANFLVDSESRLRASLADLAAAAQQAAPRGGEGAARVLPPSPTEAPATPPPATPPAPAPRGHEGH